MKLKEMQAIIYSRNIGMGILIVTIARIKIACQPIDPSAHLRPEIVGVSHVERGGNQSG